MKFLRSPDRWQTESLIQWWAMIGEQTSLAMSDDRKWFGEDNTIHYRGRTSAQEKTSFRESSATWNLTHPLELEGTWKPVSSNDRHLQVKPEVFRHRSPQRNSLWVFTAKSSLQKSSLQLDRLFVGGWYMWLQFIAVFPVARRSEEYTTACALTRHHLLTSVLPYYIFLL